MARKLTKNQKRQLREKSRKNKIKKMEKEDSIGISRKKRKEYINPKIYLILKIISIVSYPVVYFVYSPLLIVCVLYTIMLFYFSSLVENYHNHTFIKRNHIKVNKFDSLIAVILLLITFCGSFSGLTSKRKIPFFDVSHQIIMQIENTGSCLTGKRGIINGMGMAFGTKKPPTNMPMPEPPTGMKPPIEFDISDLPVEMLFSMVVSSINTILIILIPISGVVSILLYYLKIKKFHSVMNVIINDSFPPLTDEQYYKLLTFNCVEIQDTE